MTLSYAKTYFAPPALLLLAGARCILAITAPEVGDQLRQASLWDKIAGGMSGGRNLLLVLAACLAFAALRAQSPEIPDWQKAVGGKMSFEVASVRPATRPIFPNFPLGPGDQKPPGGRFSAAVSLPICITFAYKLEASAGYPAFGKLPGWATSELYEINATAEGNPTKDQMRLMMQSLLADRFKLKIHFETREGSVLAMTLVKPGKIGPKLRPHSDGPPCPEPGPGLSLSALAARKAPGLTGTFVYTLDWTPDPARNQLRLPGPPGANAPPPDMQGPTFREALRDQLGIKLVSTKGSVRTLVIDHLERPSEN